jgi:proline dehydrogenase
MVRIPALEGDTDPSWRRVAQRGSRAAILRAARSERLARVVARHGMRLGARRFVPAESLDEIVEVFRVLNAAGMRGATGLFDDSAYTTETVARHEREYAAQIVRLLDERLDANVALKLTHLGIYFDVDLMFDATRRLAELAASRSMRLRIDMEESRIVPATLALHERLRDAGVDNVGLVLQSYLRRSEQDLEELLPTGVNVRLVKGAYLEPAEVAYQDKRDVDAAYARMLRRSLAGARFTAIATHDETLIEHAKELIDKLRVPIERYEFQMLHGIATGLQGRLVREGYPLRIAAPYGPTWFPFLMRRLAERPANVGFLLRNAIR